MYDRLPCMRNPNPLNASSQASLENILPPLVAVRELRSDVDECLLPEADRNAVLAASETRRLEYLSVRWCAYMALSSLGHRPLAIRSGPSGEPIWPRGICGSMTHCLGYRAAAVARSSDYRSIGIDAEPNEVLPVDVEEFVASKREQEELEELRASRPEISWDRLLFSAKECVYKVCFPLTRQWLDFSDVGISFDLENDSFDAHVGDLSTDLPVTIHGRWMAHDYLLTAIVIEH